MSFSWPHLVAVAFYRIASNTTKQSPKMVELDLISQKDHRDNNSYANAICPFSFYDTQILQSSDVG
ncbi:hypothetical protein LB506_012712 [Fusarium annulatum]|nr:hypothetical protein LB506_012712 [Fusarium annulatum]